MADETKNQPTTNTTPSHAPVEMEYYDAGGNEVAADSPDVAYQVNPTDPGKDKFLQDLKDRAAGCSLKPSRSPRRLSTPRQHPTLRPTKPKLKPKRTLSPS